MNQWVQLVDRYASELAKYVPMPDTTPLDQQFNTGIPIANQKADDFVLRNQTLVATIKGVGEQLLEGTVKDDLL